MTFTYLPGVVPDQFSDLPKTLPSVVINVKTSFSLILPETSSNQPKIPPLTSLLSLLPLPRLQHRRHLSLRSNFFSKNSTLENSGHNPPTYSSLIPLWISLRFLRRIFSMSSQALTLGRLMDLVEWLLLSLKICLRADTLPGQALSPPPVNIYFSLLLKVCFYIGCAKEV